MPKYRFYMQREVFENVNVEVTADSRDDAENILEEEGLSAEEVTILFEEFEPINDFEFEFVSED